MEQARLVRTVRFRACHRYHNPTWTAAENARVFGPQGTSHEHDWRIAVHVSGPLDAATGWCCDLGRLDGALDGLFAGWDGGDLNELIAEVGSGAMRPSTEELARWIYTRLRGDVPPPAALVQVEVHEGDTLGSVFPASATFPQKAGLEKAL